MYDLVNIFPLYRNLNYMWGYINKFYTSYYLNNCYKHYKQNNIYYNNFYKPEKNITMPYKAQNLNFEYMETFVKTFETSNHINNYSNTYYIYDINTGFDDELKLELALLFIPKTIYYSQNNNDVYKKYPIKYYNINSNNLYYYIYYNNINIFNYYNYSDFNSMISGYTITNYNLNINLRLIKQINS